MQIAKKEENMKEKIELIHIRTFVKMTLFVKAITSLLVQAIGA